MKASRVVRLLVAGLLVGVPFMSGAQLSATARVAFNSQYVWRGITSTNRFVMQPDVVVSLPAGSMSMTLGAWGNIEPRRYNHPGEISTLGGLRGPFITQSTLWAELSAPPLHGIEATLGLQGFLYPSVGGLSEFNTLEWYASVSSEGVLAPSVLLSYDIGRVHGAYIEVAMEQGVTSEAHGLVTLRLLSGLSAGQAEDREGRDLSYFARNGFTHLDGSVRASLHAGRIAVDPEAHLLFGIEETTRLAAPGVYRRAKLWIGTTLKLTS